MVGVLGPSTANPRQPGVAWINGLVKSSDARNRATAPATALQRGIDFVLMKIDDRRVSITDISAGRPYSSNKRPATSDVPNRTVEKLPAALVVTVAEA
jgi:hypothetical protein